ncbi:calcium/proton exchanger-like protein [Phanerochaete sordida]|uniref:Calcium/proton exchanger-like protein n=1 Tax=Phanerochaete sordida TaxID=48140 RepID=A0A9P3GM31_9APHY|nr:calcium/proton exchanger-like protein [Phanerochaete sordida]
MSNAERGYAKLDTAEPSADVIQLEDLRQHASSSEQTNHSTESSDRDGAHTPTMYEQYLSRRKQIWDRLRGKGRIVPGYGQSLKNVVLSSWINVLFVFMPFAWASHFLNDAGRWPHELTFALCFVAIIPLEKMFDWGGEQMALYLGKDLGDLVIITLNNAVEAALAIALLSKCELRLLQATIIGVVVLHLLLVPGTAFLAGGATIWEQNLHPHPTQLNHSLLAVGVLTILLPTALFASLDRGAQTIAANGTASYVGNVISDHMRDEILRMSRGLAVVLLVVYVGSRIFLHNPPGEGNAGTVAPNAPLEQKLEEKNLQIVQPEIHPLACIVLLWVTIALMSVTAEFLVESIDDVREQGNIQEEWFGLILLPIVSFSADGCIAIAYFARTVWNHIIGKETMVPSELAKGRAIDLSIQFTLFWMPFLVLLGWWIDKPMSLLFDFYEVAVVLGACFLVNYVTADSKTNWVEGLIMVAFYIMIAISAWFYVGQPELAIMLTCPGSVAAALAAGGEGEGEGGEGAVVVARAIKAFL